MAFFRNSTRAVGFFSNIDWYLFFSAFTISLLGLATMRPLEGDSQTFFNHQILWIMVALAAFFIASVPSYSFLRRTPIVASLYVLAFVLLSLILVAGSVVKGAQQRFNVGFFAIQPLDVAQVVLIVVLAKYFARRHVEIAHVRHILISGTYAGLICLLVFLQPDLGGAVIIACIWLGMVLVAGISWKHVAILLCGVAIVASSLWIYALHPYQKARVLTLLHPLADIHGTGYNAYQSTVAVGSGEMLGKGIGFGTQSKLRFLPEYQTDFIFAAFAEEWGFIGVLLLIGLYSVIIFRTLSIAVHGVDNFVVLYGVGLSILFLAHFAVHMGMNMGLLPVTGTTIPFMSYGGSHLITEFASLGILMGLRRRGETVMRVEDKTELVSGVY